ncbi:hypothetical protein GcM3_025019, partial [Golovinomyces cichoracearum]
MCNAQAKCIDAGLGLKAPLDSSETPFFIGGGFN